MNITNIAIVGGTHGNEYTGIYLIKKMRQAQFHKQWEGLQIKLMIGNPRAYEQCVRFVDYDLNRSFRNEDLSNIDLSSYEANRAKVINQAIGPKGSSHTNMIIDMHTTTANMGVTIILVNSHPYNFQLASYVKSKVPNCFIYYTSARSYTGDTDHPFLNSIAPYGFLLEVGPIANGIVRHDVLCQTNIAIEAALEFVSKTNAGKRPAINHQMEVYKHLQTVTFPVDAAGNISALIHSHIQDRDYHPIQKGDPIFETLEGDTIRLEEEGVFYPVFINEAAYYYKKIAFSLAEKVVIDCEKDLTNI
jgi:aspartoacylase